MRIALAAALGATFLLGAPGAHAGPLASRAELHTALGGPGTVEDFETYSVANGNAATLDCGAITSASTCNGQGPGLVQPGLVFSNPGLLQWNGVGFSGTPSREFFGQNNPLTIDFATPVSAVGFDARMFSEFGLHLALLRVYAADDTTEIGSIAGIVLDETGARVFAGWQDAGGIGRIVLTSSAGISPVIDNLEYGVAATAVPEPAGALVLGAAMAALAGSRRIRVPGGPAPTIA